MVVYRHGLRASELVDLHFKTGTLHVRRVKQALPAHKDHGRVPVAVAIALGRRHEPLDLRFRQLLPGPQLAVGEPSGCNCSFTVAGVTSFRCALAMVFYLPVRRLFVSQFF